MTAQGVKTSPSSQLFSCSPWEHRGGTSARYIRYVRTRETRSNEESVDACVRDMRNRQKTEIQSDEEYTGGKSIHLDEEWSREEKKETQLTLGEERESRGPCYSGDCLM